MKQRERKGIEEKEKKTKKKEREKARNGKTCILKRSSD